jgi:uncharacterized membrane protein
MTLAMARKPNPPARHGNNNQPTVQVNHASWTGPLPPPAALQQFDSIVSNGAERIVSAWEQESEHRRALERRELNWAIVEAILSKVFAFIFVLAALGATIYAADKAPWVSVILGGGTITGVVWAFVKSSRK